MPPLRRVPLTEKTRDDIQEALFWDRYGADDYSPGPHWNDTWEDNMNTSSHLGFSVFS